MAVIRNKTGSPIELEDLDGITIPAGVGSPRVYDLDLTLSEISITQIATSNDLTTNLTAGYICFLDGQGFEMSINEGLTTQTSLTSVVPAIFLQNNESNVTGTPHTTLNFETKLSASNSGNGKATITWAAELNDLSDVDLTGSPAPTETDIIQYNGSKWVHASANAFIQRFTFQSDQFDNPVDSDWAVNTVAPVYVDTVTSSLKVRRFDDTTEEGVGGTFTVPPNAANVTFLFKSRAQTAPGSTQSVQPALYHRVIPNNSAVGSWSSALSLTAISIPTNAYFQYDTQTISLASLGWSAEDHVQFELTRRLTGSPVEDTLSGDWDLLEMIVELTA